MPYVPLNRIPWGAKLPERRSPYIPLVAPKQGQKVRGIILSHSITTILTHWFDERTIPCLEDPSICQGCAKGMVARWFAYIPIGALPGGRISLLSITAGAVRANPQLKDEAINFRGWCITAERAGKGVRGPMKLTLEPRTPSDALPPGFDVKAMLLSVWGLKPDDGASGVQTREV